MPVRWQRGPAAPDTPKASSWRSSRWRDSSSTSTMDRSNLMQPPGDPARRPRAARWNPQRRWPKPPVLGRTARADHDGFRCHPQECPGPVRALAFVGADLTGSQRRNGPPAGWGRSLARTSGANGIEMYRQSSSVCSTPAVKPLDRCNLPTTADKRRKIYRPESPQLPPPNPMNPSTPPAAVEHRPNDSYTSRKTPVIPTHSAVSTVLNGFADRHEQCERTRPLLPVYAVTGIR